MAILLYIILILLCIFIGNQCSKSRSGIYQYPFLATLTFLTFIVPPLFGVLHVNYLPEWSVERYILMCILCLWMCWKGGSFAKKRAYNKGKIQIQIYDHKRWMGGATILILIGTVAWLMHRSLFEANYSMHTGIAVAVGFFEIMIRFGFIMAIIHFLKTKNIYALFLVAIVTIFYFDRIILLGKRRDIIEFTFIIGGSIWFILHKTIPRFVVMIFAVILAIWFCSTGFYRSVVVSRTGERNWSKLKDMDLSGTFQKELTTGSSETIAGIYLISAAASDKAYDYGLFHWNVLVFNFVPAQLFGSAFKKFLYFPTPNLVTIAEKKYGCEIPPTTTVTGMVDCYSSFWYIGCIKFFIISYIMQRLYLYANGGNVIGQALYLYMMVIALHAITHHTQWFFGAWVEIMIFWYPVMFYAIRVPLNIQKYTCNYSHF